MTRGRGYMIWIVCGAVAVAVGIVLFSFRSAPWRADGNDGTTPGNDATAMVKGSSVLTEAVEPDIPEEVKVPILVYHHIRAPRFGPGNPDSAYEVAPEVFRRQLAYMKERGFESVRMSDIVASFSEGKPLPANPVVITFDDGRDNQYAEAFPLLKEHGFSATFFVFTNAMDRPGYLTWDQLAEMRDAGMEIGSHTVYHPFLTRSSDAELESELVGSRAKLQEKLGVSGDVIAYPFGLYDDRVLAATAEAGYVAGRGLDHRATHAAEDMLTLGSYITTSNMGRFERILAADAK